MKFFSKRWSSTPIGRSFLDDAEYIHRSCWSQNLCEAPRRGATAPNSFRFCREFLERPGKRLPVRCGPEALENVNLIRIRADQNARFLAFHAAQDSLRRLFRRSPRHPVKSLNIRFTFGCGGASANPRPARDRRPNAARMNAGDAN